jgi:hypothetical protein
MQIFVLFIILALDMVVVARLVTFAKMVIVKNKTYLSQHNKKFVFLIVHIISLVMLTYVHVKIASYYSLTKYFIFIAVVAIVEIYRKNK